MARWVRVGDEVFLADGAIVLCVEKIDGDDVECRVVRAGSLRSHKGMHVPRAEGHVEPFTEADAVALEMAVKIKADFVGLSFVRRPEDVEAVRPTAEARHRPHLVAKIETAVALDHLAGIVAMADAVMVARGDLGIQVPARRVPLIQKEIIRFCNMSGKPVITATQMLESMTRSPLPTRAEVSDVANAVLDGTDASCSTEETAFGLTPTDTVRTMAEVAEAAEVRGRAPGSRLRGAAAATDDDEWRGRWRTPRCKPRKTSASRRSSARTQSGTTARRAAVLRPSGTIVGSSTNPTRRSPQPRVGRAPARNPARPNRGSAQLKTCCAQAPRRDRGAGELVAVV